jgi:hypothetical protein
MTRAVNGSSRALPAKPRLTSPTPPRAPASAGHVVVGLSASDPWLIELPWCNHTLRRTVRMASTGASVRRATSSVTSLCGSQISTSFPPAVDEQVVDAVGTWWSARVGHLRGQHVQLDGPGPGPEDQPYAGGLGLRQGQLVVGDLLARPGGQPVRQHAARRALQVEGTANEVRADGRGDPSGRARLVTTVRHVGVGGLHGHSLPSGWPSPTAGSHAVHLVEPCAMLRP